MINELDSLVDHITLLHKQGYIDSPVYLDLTGKVFEYKQKLIKLDIEKAVLLYETLFSYFNYDDNILAILSGKISK